MVYVKPISFKVKPVGRPLVVGHKSRHRVGDTLKMDCYINNTFPSANITWFINGKMVRTVPKPLCFLFGLQCMRLFFFNPESLVKSTTGTGNCHFLGSLKKTYISALVGCIKKLRPLYEVQLFETYQFLFQSKTCKRYQKKVIQQFVYF